ncbi:MAG: hypothetical protein KY464_11845, partial [Gemmatimonadetes bacterium]|nr:hypothetical protein [Gemmatimonadota bacterium]
LDLAKVDAGALRVERAPVRAGDTVDAALALVRPQAAAGGLALSESCRGDVDAPYLGDEPRVRQILVNLLSNAVKFTPRGGKVSVSYQTRQRADPAAGLAQEGPWVAIEVEDTGIGIPSERQRSIFDPFVQVDSAHTRERGGTGLGLTISQRLALLMGGSLTVRSQPGRGSCFTVWLPAGSELKASERPDRDSLAPQEIPRLREVGHALVRCADEIVDALGDRLRSDAMTPGAESLDKAQLENHTSTFLVDIGLALVALDEGGGEPALMRDGSEIQRTISHLHGAQRARLGWTEAALRRESEVLREITDGTLRRSLAANAGEAVEEAVEILARLLHQAERVSLRGWRRSVPEISKHGETP